MKDVPQSPVSAPFFSSSRHGFCFGQMKSRRFSHEARILITNAAVIDSAFREVDPAFISCFSIDRGSDSGQAVRVAEDVMPTPDAATSFSQLLLEHSADHASRDAQPSVVNKQDGWVLMSNRLQEKLNLIEYNFCNRTQVDRRKL